MSTQMILSKQQLLNNTAELKGLKNHQNTINSAPIILTGLSGLNGTKIIEPAPPVLQHQLSLTGNEVYQSTEEATNFLLKRVTGDKPTVGIICGSGLGGLADLLQDTNVVPYSNIPHFPVSSVAGHAGKLVFGKLAGKNIVCMQGRVHLYEGVEAWKVTLPVRVMANLGVQVLIVTNAAGSLNENYDVGDIMVIKDHINLPSLAGNNPLVGLHDPRFGARFVALTDAYDRELRRMVHDAGRELNMDYLREGIYTIQVGPLYETQAECRMLRLLGSDAVGMSTVPEVAVARQCGVRCLGLSLITNKCITEYDTGCEPNHAEVMEIGQKRALDMQNLVAKIVSLIQ